MKITVEDNGKSQSAEVYSYEGMELISSLWLKLYAQSKLTHNITWLGVPIIQVSGDIMMMQELIWKVRPDVIIECGLAHGGSALFYASVCELIGKGYIIGVDVEIRQYNKIAIQNHPLSHRVKMLEGSSTSEDIITKIIEITKNLNRVMVVLDSNHSKEHVARELDLYKDIVTPGSYLVAMDGAQAFVWDIPNGKPEWKEDNPLIAIEEFLEKNSDFEVDEHYTRLKVTANPKGFLRKVVQEGNVRL
ncbi:Rhamnosyl O-methyltransferase [Candidatus Magnetomoraceae bacterium gMMP-1]